MRHTLRSPEPPPRPPFRAQPIPRVGQRGRESDAEIQREFAEILQRLITPVKKRKVQ
jgi:hypothetical protein